ncbi:heme-binding protein [Phreatobacter stygius]|uniref:Heme-binding protein n=2 Tax=Phreatobacter stygius TaxID=1940610 RepID=A0A4D7BNB1_9HYPH|nr:heme-binding protein [Phreatobacter stygius]
MLAASTFAAPAQAQVQRSPYGPPITLDQAKRVVAAAEAEARKNNWTVSIAVVDSGCNLVLLHRIDNSNLGGIAVSQDKANSACLYRASTRGAEQALAQGGLNIRLLALRGMVPLEAGIPIVVNGQQIGSIGVSGVQSNEDGLIAQAGADALK